MYGRTLVSDGVVPSNPILGDFGRYIQENRDIPAERWDDTRGVTGIATAVERIEQKCLNSSVQKEIDSFHHTKLAFPNHML